ncbi:Spy/CpxP family protein refolding chaperone [Piscirickettsia litoralis]|uniref:DUF4168 domain-containing protein n=1 Tax=Piscirickettsia litoralis TaxID=1891921 RepID=A0ABX3A3T3_9GAMM|nr:Spy/CpxP family protein refolding chaperone [Piscirickettsia litoralis]ODN43519.1 hypothetical protein BGC07_12075 [Piscirickettsia litoralis]
MKKVFFMVFLLASMFVCTGAFAASPLTSSFTQSDRSMPPLLSLFRQLQLTVPQRQQIIGIIRGLREKNYAKIEEYNKNNSKLLHLTLSDKYSSKNTQAIVEKQSKLFEVIALNQVHANRKIYAILTDEQKQSLKDHAVLLQLIDS